MPTETAIVVAGIILFFAAFAVTLAWADFYTRNYRAPGAERPSPGLRADRPPHQSQNG